MDGSVILTLVVAVATVATAAATMDYARYQREPNVSAYFEGDGSWIYLIVQNTGTDTARQLLFRHDLTRSELTEIFGPNLHGQRYIVFEDLEFLKHYTYLAPGQRIRQKWLYQPLALRDTKPRPFTFAVSYDDRWGIRHEFEAPFNVGMFGTWEMAHIPQPRPEEVVGKKLDEIHSELRSANRREELLHRRRLSREAELERAEWMSESDSANQPPEPSA